jgi:Icc-related predicted phosphoesterase
MKIDCVSDLHGYYPKLEGGDLLIVAGDLTARNTIEEFEDFNYWLVHQDYPKKIIIAGNHDGILEKARPSKRYFSVGIYLKDDLEEYEGLKIWGSPWTPTFYDWYFMKERGEEIKAMWDLIPDDIDILVTHGPPYGILDKTQISSRKDNHGHAGCMDLMNTIPRLKNLKLHVFGHIHEGYGQVVINDTRFVNASIMNEDYEPVNEPIRIIL